MDTLKDFFGRQLLQWHDCSQRYDDLRRVETRSLTDEVTGMTLLVQFNPARMVSTGARIDKATLSKRPCFLCKNNRPKEQIIMDRGDVELLVNPFPILPEHYTLPSTTHRPQMITGCYDDMLRTLTDYPGLMVFYNGPKCGASCPDHMHLQAGSTDVVPLLTDWPRLSATLRPVATLRDAGDVAVVEGYACPAILLRSATPEGSKRLFDIVYGCMSQRADETEPMMNVVSWRSEGKYMAVVFPRKKHRPACYPSDGNADAVSSRLISPGAIDMAGLIITPREQDFRAITAAEAAGILREVCVSADELNSICEDIAIRMYETNSFADSTATQDGSADEPEISVGIASGTRVTFRLNGSFTTDGAVAEGEQTAELVDGMVEWGGKRYAQLLFAPADESSFTLHDVTIGINFHWERHEEQSFCGKLLLLPDGGRIHAINILPVEQYLESVISSEMSATSSLELLKAHAVISRSWLLAQIRNRMTGKGHHSDTVSAVSDSADEIVRWYDRDDHTLFDVCADDHCQRYQGITRQTTLTAHAAIAATRGEVLMSGGELCDARFSKCCGGRTEEFGYCWDNIRKPYLVSVPDEYCDTNDATVLRQVLNDYDQETHDFYHWSVTLSQAEIQRLLQEKMHLQLGEILDMQPLEYGKSGRISRLKITGTERTVVIGKELEIRRALSDSHLYSSAFTVSRLADGGFLLEGKGWGHGVGLCQIGAAVMGAKGFAYDVILAHYYQNARLEKLYL